MKNSIVTTEVLIIGSGPGGATVANQLSKKNIDFLIAEEGKPYKQKNKPIETFESFFRYYQNGGALPIFSSPIFPFASAKIYGGGSEVNGGLFWRTPDFILNDWLRNNKISPEFYRAADSIFSKIESDLKVNTDSVKLKGNLDSILIHDAAIKNKLMSIEVPKAVKDCQMHNRCASICTSGAKQSMTKTYLNNNKIKSLINCKILKLVFNGQKVKYALGILDNKTIIKIYARHYFLSAGPIHTPIVLRNSGIRKNIGNNLMFHHNIKFIVDYGKPIKSQVGTMFNRQVQEFMKSKNFILMATNYRRNLLASALESKSEMFQSFMNKYDNLGLYTAQIRSLGLGRVKNFLGLGPLVRYKFNQQDLMFFKHAMREGVKLFFDAGAQSIILPIKNSYHIQSFEAYEAIESQIKITDLEMVSVHAMASCPMGKSQNSPVDWHGKLKSADNIYLADASVLPTNLGESPQGTIMCFAHFIAQKFTEEHYV